MSIPTQTGDLYQTANTAKNIVLRPAPSGPFTITAKLNHKGLVQYQQAGVIVYGTDDNYVKLDRTASNGPTAATTEFFEFIQEVNATARNQGTDRTANLAATFPQDFYVRIVWNGTTLTGQYSTDGQAWTQAGRTSTAFPANAQVGFFALSNAAATEVTALFDWFTIDGANVPPTCINADPVIGSATRTPAGDVTTGQAVEFAAAATDADGDALTYAWEFGDGGTSSAQNPSHTYTAAGTYSAKVTVSDGKGGTASRTLAVVVTTPQNANPTVTAARTPTGNVRVGVPVAFTATGTDPDGDSLTYAWDFGDGTTSSEQNPTKTFLAAATRTVKVTVSDGKGGTGSAELTVVVQANRNPTTATPVATPQAGIAPLAVQFTGVATDPDGHTVSYSWDLDGDGTFETTTQNPTFTYNTAGTYLPVLRVTDPFGGVSNRTLTVNVLSAEQDPAAKFKVLVYSRTAGFRHSAIERGSPPSRSSAPRTGSASTRSRSRRCSRTRS